MTHTMTPGVCYVAPPGTPVRGAIEPVDDYTGLVEFMRYDGRRRGHVIHGELASLEPIVDAPPLGAVLARLPDNCLV